MLKAYYLRRGSLPTRNVISAAPTERIFVKFNTGDFMEICPEKSKFVLTSHKTIGHFTCSTLYCYITNCHGLQDATYWAVWWALFCDVLSWATWPSDIQCIGLPGTRPHSHVPSNAFSWLPIQTSTALFVKVWANCHWRSSSYSAAENVCSC